MRDAQRERERAARTEAQRGRAEQELATAKRRMDAGEQSGPLLQAAGQAQGRMEALASVKADYERRAAEREHYAQSLRKQIDDLEGRRDELANRLRQAKETVDLALLEVEEIEADAEPADANTSVLAAEAADDDAEEGTEAD